MTRDDWSGCDNEAQEETLYTLLAMIRILREGSANLAKCTGKHALPSMTSSNLMCISAHTRAANVLRDLADGALVAVNPLAAQGIEDFHAKKGKLWEQYNEVVRQRDKANDDYMKVAAEGSPSEWRDEHDKRVKERDEAIKERDEAVRNQVSADTTAKWRVVRAEQDALLAEAAEYANSLKAEVDEAMAIMDLTARIVCGLRSKPMPTSVVEMAVAVTSEARQHLTNGRPGSWGAGKGPTSEAKAEFVDAMAKPAEVKPSCHGCEWRDSDLEAFDNGGEPVVFCNRSAGRTINPGEACPTWCPRLEANQ